VEGSLFQSFMKIGLTSRSIMRRREGLRVWLGLDSSERSKIEGKRVTKR